MVVPVRNGMPWVEHQLRALTAQQIEVDWEVVVAENGSNDGTRSCVQRWSERCPRIHLVDASAGRGAGAAATLASGRPVAAWWPSVTPTTWCGQVGSPRWLQHWPTPIWSLGCSTSAPWTGSQHRFLYPPPHGSWGSSLFALGANLAVSRDAFEAVQGFYEELSPEEDVDLCWRLQLAGYRFAVTSDAIVEKRERAGASLMLRAAWAYGRCGPRLYRRYRADGMRRDLRGAAKAWVWLVVASPGLVNPKRRRQWVRTLGIRTGRVAGSVHQRVFFP